MTNTVISAEQSFELADQALDLLKAVAEEDGTDAFSEQFLRGLTEPELGHEHLTARVDGALVGLASSDGQSTELAVHPAFRGRGIGRRLIDASPTPAVWAHGDTAGARALAASLHMRKTRELLVMAVEGRDLETAAVYIDPPGFTSGSLADARGERPDVERAWLRVNNEAFSWHPEQGGWDLDRLHTAMSARWFTEEDVLLLWEGPELAGFHWTKRHDPRLWEIYVVGLADAFRGRGLGDPLVRLGLAHMVSRGAQRVILYVEADNGPAVRAYAALGFTVAERHVVYEKTRATPPN
ncbi:mycothiol synthase [Corynebacterium pacaense]|uniref:mycothiol synthase n=1 Tax=Corynebacterium pacaense TaxID=1816684 RepID=UPI0009B9995E|nr:mycothiol synthase [Corynebacterium pacaense]